VASGVIGVALVMAKAARQINTRRPLPDMVRLSIGIGSIDDILWDIDRR
jgi:O-acetylhomoserine/O-acetylserine sulfhydrylase-like pyridoxal-dependent enzyme